jgi:MFS family permease
LKEFWRKQSRNYKVFLIRDTIGRLGGGRAPPGMEPRGGGAYWSIFMDRLGATSIEIGLIRSISSAVNVLLALPFGWLTDRTEKMKRLYLVGRASFIPVALMRFLATTWPFCLLISVWETISMRITDPVSQIISIDSLNNEDRTTGLSLHRTITSIAGIVAPLISAYVITSFGGLDSADSIRPVFFIQFVLGIIIFMLLVTKMHDVNFQRVKRDASVLGHFFSVFKDVPVLKFLLLRRCAMTFINQLRMPFNGLYMVDVKGADEFIVGWRGTASTALIVLLSMLIGQLAERYGRRRITYYGRVFGWLSYLVTIFTPLTHPEYLIVAGLLEGLRMVMFIGWQAFDQELIPLEGRGRYSGVSMLANGNVGVIAPILGGVIWNINPDYIWWISLFGDAFLILPIMIIIGYKVSKT